MNSVNRDRVYDWNFQKKFHIKWWEKVLLWFMKPYYSYDYGYQDDTVVVIAKKMFGKIYIVGEQHIDNLKKPL